jgi:hypothetical protein
MHTLIYIGEAAIVTGASVALLPTLVVLALGKRHAKWFPWVVGASAITAALLLLAGIGILIYGIWTLPH